MLRTAPDTLSSYSGSLGTLKPVAKLKVSVIVSAIPTIGATPSYKFLGKSRMVPSATSCAKPNAPGLGMNPSSPGAMYSCCPSVEGCCTRSGWVGVPVGTSEPAANSSMASNSSPYSEATSSNTSLISVIELLDKRSFQSRH